MMIIMNLFILLNIKIVRSSRHVYIDYNNIIKNIFDTIDEKCTQYYDIDWKQLLQNEWYIK